MSSSDTILVINAGSSSIKFVLFAQDTPTRVAAGAITGIGGDAHFLARDADGNTLAEQRWNRDSGQRELIEYLLQWIDAHFGGATLRAAGHRIVHGGPRYSAPVLLNTAVIAELNATVPLAPLHEPHNLSAVASLAA